MKKIGMTLFALFSVSAVFAQPPGGGGGGMPDNATIFANNDANGDGEITKAEADEAGLPLSQNWDMFDLNSDGKVVAEELDQVRGQFAAGGPGGPGAGGQGAAGPPGGQAGGDDE